MRGRALIEPLQLGDRPLDRAARHELHDGERDQHDAENGRDHQQEAAGDIGEHVRLARAPLLPPNAIFSPCGEGGPTKSRR